ncbi:MAG: alpha/beta hydrolase family esterase [Actinomycetes bacterium]
MAGWPAEPVRRRARRAGLLAALGVLVVVAGCTTNDSATPAPRLSTTVPAALVRTAPSPGCAAPSTTVPVTTVVAGRTEVLTARPEGGRWAYLSVPPQADGQRPLPLVMDLHGYSEGADVHLQFTKMEDLGRAKGFLTLVPQGSGDVPFWNSFGRPAPDDVGYLTSLVDQVASTECVDLNRVYVDGMSNGAFMTSLLACERPGVFAAAVTVAGLQFPEGCAGGPPVPVMAVHGTDDDYVRYEGGFGDGVRSLGVDPAMADTAGRNMSVPDAAAAWARRNRCTAGAAPSSNKVGSDVQLMQWPGCAASVQLYVVAGGGHSWPGSEFAANLGDVVGRTSMSVDATDLAWRFFEAHPRRTPAAD